jgi:hypothetical protein
MTEEPRLVTHEEKPHVMREGSLGECHFCGVPIKFETRFYRGRRRILVLSQVKRSGVGTERSKWTKHRCPVAIKRERQRKAGYR